jgi:hypothetical protein
MANTVGKISGQMLESNLLRRDMQTGDENLAFDTDLIFIDVFNNRVGIKTDTPFRPLLVNSVLSSTNFIVDTVLTTPNFTISSNTIDLDSGNIELSATGIGAEIQSTGIQSGNLKFDQNEISNLVLNQDIDLNPSGLGKVNFYNELRIDGDLHATGDIIADGNVTLGSDDTDNIIFNAKIGSDINPDQTNTYDIGNSAKKFDNLYTYLINGQTLTSGGAVVDGIDLSTRPGNTWFVSSDNGNNTNVGDHPNGPFATIEWALSQATAGDTIYIYSGYYLENLPLTVPAGVTVKGEGVRSVTIQPAVDSESTDVFLLNGETTISDLTIKNFGGFGFTFDNNFTVTTRSPYIQNVSLITNTTLYPKVTLNDPNPDSNSLSDQFGSSIKASESHFIVGARGEASSSGAAYIYSIDGTLLHTLTNPNAFGTTVSDEFGYSVGISESYAIVGAPGEDTTLSTSTGKAYIFSTTTGALLHTIDNPTDGTTLQFGCSVAISESYAIVATRFRAYIFSTSTGALLRTIIPPAGAGSAPAGRIGCQVDITETHAIVGAASAFTSSGRAYIYNPATGVLLFTLVNPNATGSTPGDFFGSIVALSTSYAVVTAPFEDVGGGMSGTAYVYQLSTGTLLYTLNNPNAYNTPPGDQFGWAGADISDSYIIVGAEQEDDDSGITAGKVYIFSTSTGELLYTLDNPKVFGTTLGDRFGYAVAVAGLKVIVGAYLEDDSTYTSAGKTFVYDLFRGGALVDGSKANSTSNEASMLFHSVTMIIPKSYGIAMSNGVRVEWLNSFIYYAYKGLFAENGSLGFASLGTRYGAEVRSIGSANVYGNYGAYADGDQVLMYLINHNFGYIGAGADTSNDPTNVIQANETVRLNNGTIYFQSMDHIGDFRVGDVFRVESSTGNIEFQTSVVSNSSITLTDGVNTTFIDATEVLTGNIKIYGNTIESIVQDINLDAANNTIDITSNFDINSNLYVGNSASVSSDVIFGSLNTDFLEINSKIASDLIPSNNTLDVGNTVQSWNNLYASSLLFDNIAIYNNVIETKISNSDLELRSNGTGNILATSDITVGQDFVAQGSVNFAYLTLSNLLSNNLVVDNLVTISTKTTFDDIDFLGNRITTTVSNADLELIANGTGSVIINGDSLLLEQNLSVNGFTNLLDTNINGLLTASSVVTNQVNASNLVLDTIVIAGNTVNTVVSNSDLELRANGTGNVIVNDSLIVNQNLTINGTSNLKDTNVLGIVSTSNIFSTNYISSELIGDTISVQGNVIRTTVSNADLELRANGTGALIVEDSLTASQDLFVNGTASLLNANANTLNLFSNTVATNIVTNFFDNGQILIDDNFISTTQSNANLELYANNLGGVIFDQTLRFTNSTISNILLSGTEFERSINFTPQSGYQFNINSTGSLKIPVGSNTNRLLTSSGEIRYNNTNNSFEGRISGATKSISGLFDIDRNTYITAELTPGANDNTIRMYANGIVSGSINSTQTQFLAIQVDEIRLNDNKFRTINSNADIELNTSGTGKVNIKNNITIEPSIITNIVNNAVTEIRSTGAGYVKFADTFGLRIPVGTDSQRPTGIAIGATRYNTDQSYLEIWDGTNWVTAAGGGPTVSSLVMEDLSDTYALIFG